MRLLITTMLGLVGTFLPKDLKDIIGVAEALVGRIQIPDDDPRWQQVYIYTAAVVEDVRVAQEQGYDVDQIRKLRLVAENRIMHQLADLHLIERG